MTGKRTGGCAGGLVALGVAVVLGCAAVLSSGAALAEERAVGHAIMAPRTGGEFVAHIGQAALAELAGRADRSDTIEDRLKVLVKLHFDVPAIARAAVGREAWEQARESERASFMEAYEAYAIEVYASYFEQASGAFTVTGERRLSDQDHLVRSQLERRGARDLRVDWRIRERPDGFAILDLVIQGISVSQVQQEEFAMVLRQRGRSLPALTRALDELLWARRSARG